MFKITGKVKYSEPVKPVNLPSGETIRVHKTAKYLAVDKTGELFAYSRKPRISDDLKGAWNSLLGTYWLIGTVAYSGDWKESLIKI